MLFFFRSLIILARETLGLSGKKVQFSTKGISRSSDYVHVDLYLVSGDVWHRHRKLLTPTFHFKILGSSIEVMHKQANVLMTQLESQVGGDDFNMQSFIEKCSLDIICGNLTIIN